jgi:hypothetical protein
MVIEKRNEIRDGAIEVNVVFPERIVGIDEERLGAPRVLRHSAT